MKSTESIHEARRKIENHQKIITLLNNLSALDLSDPIVKAEYLKNVIDFEEKYGKLEEEEEGPQTKRSKESNKDKSPKNMEIKEELKDFNLKNEKSNIEYLETQTKKLEEEINEGSNNLNLDFLNKLDDLKKNYDSLIKTDKISLETLVQEPEMTQSFLKENQNILIDNLFLTNLPNSDQINPNEKEKDDIKIDNNKEILLKSETKHQENLIKTEQSQEKKNSEPFQSSHKPKNDFFKKDPSKKQQASKTETKKTIISQKEDDKTNSKNLEIDNKEIKDIEKNHLNRQSFYSKNSKKSLQKIKEKQSSKHDVMDHEKKRIKNREDENSLKPINNDDDDDSENTQDENNEDFANLDILPQKPLKQKVTKNENLLRGLSKHHKTPTLDLAQIKQKNSSKKIKFSSEKEISFDSSKLEQFSQSEKEIEISNSQISINNKSLEENSNESAKNNIDFEESSEIENRISTNKNFPYNELVTTSRKDLKYSEEREEYELIHDLSDEDLEIILKTSNNDEVLNRYKTPEIEREMQKTREKLIKKLEKKIGKEKAMEKIKQIERRIVKASKKVKNDLFIFNCLN